MRRITTGPLPLPISVARGMAGRIADVGIGNWPGRLQSSLAGLKAAVSREKPRTDWSSKMGEMIFPPEQSSFLCDTAQDGASSVLVNYIVRSGQTYEIPVNIGGDKSFRAHALNVSITQRLWVPHMNAATQMHVMPSVSSFDMTHAGAAGGPAWTTKFSLFPLQPLYDQSPCINYVWNCQESSTRMFMSDRWIPYSALMHRTCFGTRQIDSPFSPCVVFDGAPYRFDCPWEFKNGAYFIFHFRPVTDIYQYDSSVATVLPWDDRQHGVRDQRVTVQVELMGESVRG